MGRILVLGAGGFVGRRIVAALAAEPGTRPVALVRGGAPQFPDGVELCRCDATDAEALRRALHGASAVVNCIAGSEAAMVAVTRNLREAAGTVGLERLVHLSSMAVYGAATGLVDEDAALDDAGSAYARGKLACEELLGADPALDTVILRPGCVHGPGSPQWTVRIARLLRQGRIGDLAENGDGICNLTYIDDLVRAVIVALRRPKSVHATFNVSDPDPGTWNAYFIDLGRAIGAVPVTRVTPRWQAFETKVLAPVLHLAGRGAGSLGLGRAVPAFVPPSVARLWRQDIVLDHRRADQGLAFGRTAPRDAIAATALWLRESGLAPP